MGASFGFLFWIIGALLFHFQLNVSLTQNVANQFEKNYQEKCIELNSAAHDFVAQLKSIDDQPSRFKKAVEIKEETGFDYYIYEKDSLQLWTTNNAATPVEAGKGYFGASVIFLENGWYQVVKINEGSTRYIALYKIKNQYKYVNEDLVNEFNQDLMVGFPAELTFEKIGFPIKGLNGKRAFSIIPQKRTKPHEQLELIIFSCYLLAFVILLQLLINAIQRVLISKPFLLIVFPISIVVLRYIWLAAGWHGFMGDFELFNPELFASSKLVPSLGDLIINVTLFYFLVNFLQKRTRNWFKEGNMRLKLVVFVVPLFLVSFYVAFKINDIIYSLVYDSNMSFDLERLFDFSLYSFLGIAIIGASFYAYFKLLQYIIIQLKKNNFEWNRLAFLWVVTSGVYIIFDQINFNHAFLTSMWPVFLSGSLLWFQLKEKEYKFAHVISIVAFISFYAAFILQGYTDSNEKELRVAQAEMIAKDKDPFSEFEYDEVENKMEADTALVNYFGVGFNQSAFSEDLETSYFKELKNDFDLTFYLFGTDKKMVVDYGNYELKDYTSFEDIIAYSGEQSLINRNLYFIKDYTDKLTYIAKYPIRGTDTTHGYLFTEFRSKKFPEDIGLPSLLLDEGMSSFERLKAYSIAKYVDDKLVTRKGEFAYPTIGTQWDTKNAFVERDGYDHYVFQEEEGFTTVISKKIKPGFYLFTSFSYLLIIFGVLLLIPLGLKQFETGISFKKIKLNVKIQAVLIGLILTTLIAFAIGAGTFVKDQYNQSNEGFIKEKLGSVKTELESKLKTEGELKTNLAGYLEFILKKFSKVFVTDINIYNTEGNLLASSQPKIYSKGLISQKMNTAAFQEIHLSKKSEYVHEEIIGNLNFLSAYGPFVNQKGEFLAYANVQYISRQNEFEDQISSFLLAIINIMVLMLAISTILAITVSNRLTRPLKYIQESLKNVQIGARYREIEYEGTDEIGELVKEYNSKVKELQENAEALAKSERESAWREMAKQVAHEIKNPLTPMKLSIQHLKRSINIADPESKEKLDRVTNSLIEQIDALTKIANEFSNFAKMPKANEIELNLSEIVKNVVEVFKQDEEFSVDLDFKFAGEAVIWADKDLLLRVFNNLVKNAIQSIPPETKGKIKVHLEEKNGDYIVSVKDNGVGIEADAIERIFVPYFTTKSKGTGLGLAMSKQIVESLNGKIWFESSPNKGTIFYVSFPQFKN